MILAKSKQNVDHKDTIGNSELTLTTSAFFTTSELLLPCVDKSKLIHVLEKLKSEETRQKKLTDRSRSH